MVNLDQFMSSYSTLIQYILQLKNGKLHSKGIKVVEDGMDYKKAVKVAIREYKHVLGNYLDEVIDNENSDEDAARSSVNFVKAISPPSSIIVCSSKRDFLDSL
jgi:monomeric isocitrate dehydrogenase